MREEKKDILYKWCRFEPYKISVFLLANGKPTFVGMHAQDQ